MPLSEKTLQQLNDNDPALASLDLTNCLLSDSEIEKLAALLKNNHILTTLILDGNKIESSGAKTLAGMLKENDTITYLSLENNKIGDSGFKALATILKFNRSLTCLKLRDHNSNRELTYAASKEFGSALKENHTITRLGTYISHHSNKIQKRLVYNRALAKQFLYAVAQNDLKHLQALHQQGVSVNCMDDDGKTALQKAISNGHLQVGQWLVAQGALINQQRFYNPHLESIIDNRTSPSNFQVFSINFGK